MDAAKPSLVSAVALLIYLPWLVNPARAESLPAGRVIPLDVHQGVCSVVVPTPNADEKYYLIVSSLSRASGPFSVSVRTRETTSRQVLDREQGPAQPGRPSSRPLSPANPAASWDSYPPMREPAPVREFYVFTKDQDLLSPAGYVAVTGELRAVGTHCQIYVDRGEPDPGRLNATIGDLKHTFDDIVYPQACRSLGRALDVDRDGRFTILLSPWLGKLSDGKVAIDGFVRGSDFYRDLGAPFGNRCDMLYLNSAVKPGAHLRALLAHEFTHAIIFSEHVFGDYQSRLPRMDEESWLNEGLSHLAEDLNEAGWSNLDYRVSAFLNAPERYQLVVGDYYGAGLWRSHGHRGATYLFLRWCVDRHGPELLKRLIQTNRNGVDNLEAATGETLADLFRAWSAWLVMNDTRFDSSETATGAKLREPLGGRLLAGPRFRELSFARDGVELQLAGTASAFFLVHSPAGKRARLTIRSSPDAELQASLVRVPERTARIEVRAERGADAARVRVAVTAHDDAVHLKAVAWEKLAPRTSRREDTSFDTQRRADDMLAAWFDKTALSADGTIASKQLRLPGKEDPNTEWAVKVLGEDQQGHRVSGWTVVTNRPN